MATNNHKATSSPTQAQDGNPPAGTSSNHVAHAPAEPAPAAGSAGPARASDTMRRLRERTVRVPVVDPQRVERQQRAITNGTYAFDAARVAGKLLQFEQQLNGRASDAAKRGSHAGTAERLGRLLAHETDQFSRLLEALQLEHQALSGNDPDGIEGGIASRQVLVEEIGHSAGKREALLVGAGFAPDASGTEAFIRACPDLLIEPLLDKWQALQALVRECRACNQVNGKIMERSLCQIQHTLSKLRAKVPATAPINNESGANVGNSKPRSPLTACP